jgi:pyridoxal phosphate enzyme (YggS family)
MFSDRFKIISHNILKAIERSGRTDPHCVQLVAVSKTHPPEAVLEALENGVTVFGENRVQEAKAKIPLLPSRCRWHFIGHLQKNKIRQALPLFELIHGIDSLTIARDTDRIAAELGLFPKVLLEVNVAAEASKFGFTPEQLESQIEPLLALPRLQISGLMTIPPPAPTPEDSRRYFVALRNLREKISASTQVHLPELSMGMSGDYEVAIEEGATLVRIGSALFGERTGKTWKPPVTDSLDDL